MVGERRDGGKHGSGFPGIGTLATGRGHGEGFRATGRGRYPGGIPFHDWTERICRWILGGVFVLAGTIKLLAPDDFARQLGEFGIVPEDVLLGSAIGLAAIESLAGIGLVLGVRGSLPLTTTLLLGFVAVLVYGLAVGLDVECGCFGPGEIGGGGLAAALWRDLVMLAMCAYLFWLARRRRSVSRCTASS